MRAGSAEPEKAHYADTQRFISQVISLHLNHVDVPALHRQDTRARARSQRRAQINTCTTYHTHISAARAGGAEGAVH